MPTLNLPKYSIAAALILTILLAAGAGARIVWLEADKLTASDAAAGYRFGNAVDIYGDSCVVGSLVANSKGAAYTFTHSTSTQIAKLTAPDGQNGDYFGCSVAIMLDYVLVGSFYDVTDAGARTGSAYLFYRNAYDTKLTASDAADGDRFGCSVAVGLTYAVVGAYTDDNSKGTDAGAVYVFYKDGPGWSEHWKIIVPNGATDDWFGYSVDHSYLSSYIIAGSPGDDDNGSMSGSAYIFPPDGTPMTKLLAPDGSNSDSFGKAVSMCDSYCIVGAPLDDDNGSSSGSAYIFKRNDTSWDFQVKLTAPDGAKSDQFGMSVSIDGDYCIVGSLDDDYGDNSGSAYIFQRHGASWGFQAKLNNSDAEENDYFGSAVAIEAPYALAGAEYNDDDGSNSGSAYTFKLMDCPDADLTADCYVGFADFAIFADQWLTEGG